jgi:hypothetical protein
MMTNQLAAMIQNSINAKRGGLSQQQGQGQAQLGVQSGAGGGGKEGQLDPTSMMNGQQREFPFLSRE